jgi:hypothetical protein
MTSTNQRRIRIGVLSAISVILILAGLLASRLFSDARVHAAAPPPGNVPAPKAIDVKKLSVHCWSCPGAAEAPLDFHTDLDLLAPLGTGPANAATWFAAFAKPNGSRAKEGSAAVERSVERSSDIGKILPPDDPLLLEAEKWVDQSTMKFYPEIFEVQGGETQIQNLLLCLIMARSWIARGMDATSFDAAMVDFRRAMRLGRLLRQEDAILISDLVGIACIRMSANAIFERARNEGKLDLALTASMVTAEASALRLLSGARLTSLELGPYVRKQDNDSYKVEVPDPVFEHILALCTGSSDRRFRQEALMSVHFIEQLGNTDQMAKARTALASAAKSQDKLTAVFAESLQNRKVTPEEIQMLLEQVTPFSKR